MADAAGRLDYQPLFGKSARAPTPKAQTRAEIELKPQAEGIIFKPEVTVFHFTDRPYANERVTQTQDKERCIKGQIYFELLYVSCI